MPTTLNEREFELVNIVGAQLALNQREVSRRMNLSLGMTNMLLRRMVTKGYIRIRQLNKKKVEYLLTPQGFAEKMQKSVKYTLKTINSISLIKNRLFAILKDEYEQGTRKFYILGGTDLAGLIEMTMNDNFPHDFIITRINVMPAQATDGVVLVCQEDFDVSDNGTKILNVIEELAKDQVLLEHGLII
ncbi:MAG: winged helix-turn-helix transcriptional regulator [Candidatus Omnitrophica bacterium]|nr:winged helix-turn-helix transcriptional regulator [Candidatus Omnitrophota bacterium]